MNKQVVVGVDVGGTKIAVGFVDCEGSVLLSERYPTNAGEGREAILQRIIGHTKGFLRRAEGLGLYPVALGIATPGLLDYERGIVRFATTNLKGWTGVSIVSELEQALGLPCAVENDGNAAAVAESRRGAGVGADDLLYISVGTGIGGGIILGGKLVRGSVGGAGGFGHVSIDYSGPACYCGNHGCVELYASGRAIAERLRDIPDLAVAIEGKTPSSPVEASDDGVTSNYEENVHKGGDQTKVDYANEQLVDVRNAIAMALQGNRAARSVLEEAGRYLGMAAASAINLLNPQVVVVGGGIATAGDLLLRPMRQVIEQRTFPPVARGVQVRRTKLGAHAGLVGASLIAWDMFTKCRTTFD